MCAWFARIHEFNGLCLVRVFSSFYFSKKNIFIYWMQLHCVKETKKEDHFANAIGYARCNCGNMHETKHENRKRVQWQPQEEDEDEENPKKNCNVRKWHLIQIKIQLAHYTRQWLQNKTEKRKQRKKRFHHKRKPIDKYQYFRLLEWKLRHLCKYDRLLSLYLKKREDEQNISVCLTIKEIGFWW